MQCSKTPKWDFEAVIEKIYRSQPLLLPMTPGEIYSIKFPRGLCNSRCR